ncbi:MAG: Unknown protein [uncultured Sulfurovum sp.]|uniref:LysM domain-containing protein n=1 Tax=uncultured Sulfurovum sp. TaxID=269237 RepID=A0A6S6T0U4_9BACT|nr:MAG: Unknown protein [uncultured Sulfurovum sp.]
MFQNYEEDYINATKHARINNKNQSGSSNLKLVIVNFLLILVLGIITFFYLKNETSFFSDLFSKKEAVLGVSETISEAEMSDEELIRVLKISNEDEINDLVLRNAMKVLVNESSIKSQSSYTKEIARELEDKQGFQGRVIIVKQGDTLSSLSEKFYGNSMDYSKIIESNEVLSPGSHLLSVGQTLKIPY